jgi:Sulfotransferase family
LPRESSIVFLLPDVVIGGAPRSGTTFLCEILDKHPDVHVARPFIPEPKVCLIDLDAGDEGIRQRYHALFAAAPPGARRIEKTSYYFENDEARDRLARLLPAARFVFILREPVARAHSNWLRTRAQGLETLPFAQAIAKEGRRCSPLPPHQAYARPFDYMTRSRYGTLAQGWIAAVGRERLRFYVLETALAAPEPFVQDLQAFVGVTPLPWAAVSTGRVNANEGEPDTIDPELARTLRQRIRPEIDRLAALTGLDVSPWGY